jgi:hypothetical protein
VLKKKFLTMDDTIDVAIGETTYRVRYIGIATSERGE